VHTLFYPKTKASTSINHNRLCFVPRFNSATISSTEAVTYSSIDKRQHQPLPHEAMFAHVMNLGFRGHVHICTRQQITDNPIRRFQSGRVVVYGHAATNMDVTIKPTSILFAKGSLEWSDRATSSTRKSPEAAETKCRRGDFKKVVKVCRL